LPTSSLRRTRPAAPEATRANRYSVSVAHSPEEIRECQRLRYLVFAQEMGADLHSTDGLDHDRFDPFCYHLLVRDVRTGEAVATTRLLDNEGAARAGGFYSETEFDLGAIRTLGGRFLEIGRTCIHRDYRRGAALPVLWQGLARFTMVDDIDYLFGCASIPIEGGMSYVYGVADFLRAHHFAPEQLRVEPRVPLGPRKGEASVEAIVPTLLKAYLRQGAVICGEPCLDEDFGVADVFVLVKREHIARRYARHFLEQNTA
jgi:putative hemolysin